MSLVAKFLLLFLAISFSVSAAEESQAFISAAPGDVISLTNLWSHLRELPRIETTITPATSPQFLFSDKPEYFYTGNGISLQESVHPGAVRLYIYHVPTPANGPHVISAVLENLGEKELHLHFAHRAFPKPSRDYLAIGKTGLLEYFNSSIDSATHVLAPGQRLILDPRMDAFSVVTDQLVHGFYEFEIDQPARVTVFQKSPGDDSLKIIDQLPRLPYEFPGRTANGAGRGLFTNADFNVTNETVIDTAAGPTRLILADGRHDLPITGQDGLAESKDAKDHGNYGCIYHVHLHYQSTDGRSLALLMTRAGSGGKWCGSQAGAVQVSDGTQPFQTIAIPANRVAYGDPGEMVLVKKFPAQKTGGVIEIIYSPFGASCMPTPFVLVPY